MGDGQDAAEVPAGVRVVRLPAEVDYGSAERVRQDLAAAFASGAAVVIADFSWSTFCDSAGIRETIVAYKLAAAKNVVFRLVMPSASILRVFAVTGLTTMLAIYPSLAAALAGGPVPQGQPDRP